MQKNLDEISDRQYVSIPSSDLTAKQIQKQFQKRYLLGDIAIMEYVCIASLFNKNCKPINLMVTAPSGQMKSSMMNTIKKTAENYVYEIPSRFTPFGLSMYGDRINNRCLLINDLVRTFDGLAPGKIAELVGWLAELLSEGKAGSKTAKESELTAHISLIANIPMTKFKDIKNFFTSSTLSERIIQIFYLIKKEEVRKLKRQDIDLKIQLHEMKIDVPKTLRKEIFELSDKLAVLQQYEPESVRTDEITENFVKSYALLNGRNKVKKTDLNVFYNLIQKYCKRVL